MTLVAGSFAARAVTGALATTAKGNPQVAVLFELTEEPCIGDSITWYGHFTDATSERTLESLRIMGWKTDDLDNLDGITENDVRLVLKEEEFEGKTSIRVAFVNRPTSLAIKAPMSPDAASSFAKQMRAAAVASRSAAPKKATQPQQAPQSRQVPAAQGKPAARPGTTRQQPPPEFNEAFEGDDIPF